ncbi:MAG: HXXEE domain-containing protein [Bacteroidales bacterium]|nr:MAG: HXXEE domain-containing protein [Bacteroidales bacterium]
MLSKRFYNILVGLFPLVYLIHNAEEWILLNTKISAILIVVPSNVKAIMPSEPQAISTIFGFALIFATIIPLVVALIIWNRINVLNIKILIVISFVTLINAISHISSSFVLGFISPGFITGILLCIPYSMVIIHFVRKNYTFTFRQYLILALGSLAVYALGLGLSWLVGLLVFLF